MDSSDNFLIHLIKICIYALSFWFASCVFFLCLLRYLRAVWTWFWTTGPRWQGSWTRWLLEGSSSLNNSVLTIWVLKRDGIYIPVSRLLLWSKSTWNLFKVSYSVNEYFQRWILQTEKLSSYTFLAWVIYFLLQYFSRFVCSVLVLCVVFVCVCFVIKYNFITGGWTTGGC